ncbi:MAG: hypothetical protein IKJ01_04615 [Lachnospiraceae bacterium]|nr:hypothetical protein [Lachnospiraceae bacterium]
MTNTTKFLIRYLFVTISGVLLHFAYNFSGQNGIVGLFTPVNESTWEHLKLLFFPMLLLTVWDLFKIEEPSEAFLPARLSGIIAGMIFIVVVFYTITGIIGKSIDWLNITIYFLSVLFAFWIEKKIYGKNKILTTSLSIGILILLSVLFVSFTFSPPNIGLFQVP